MTRASLSGFSVLGSRQAVPAEISGPASAGELDATRTLDVANRSAVVFADAEILIDAIALSHLATVADICRTHMTGMSLAKPDLSSGSISVEFEEVYDI